MFTNTILDFHKIVTNDKQTDILDWGRNKQAVSNMPKERAKFLENWVNITNHMRF